MSKADLTRKADLSMMTLLSEPISDHEKTSSEHEKPGSEPTTPPHKLKDRNGFITDFLDGWEIPLPLAVDEQAGDMRELRREGKGVELKYQNFSVIMSASRRLPMLTAVNINGEESRSLPRIQTWSFDGRLDPSDQWGNEIYYKSPFDRGHMVRREDPNWGTLETAKTANVDTFHFTNSCPQISEINQQTWLGLENYILKNAKVDKMRVCVFTGPFFSDSDWEYRGALIPNAFWKVVAIVTEDGRPSATAYRISQEKEISDLEVVYSSYKTFQISIRQVMDQAKIDFSNLLEYDGFSKQESITQQALIERIDSLERIRV